MIRRVALLVAVGCVLAASTRSGLVEQVEQAAFADSSGRFDSVADDGVSPCEAWTDKQAEPARVLVGDLVTVTLDLRVDCPGEPVPLDIVLVLDRSASMTGQPIADARDAATAFVDLVDLARSRVGVVSFARSARTDLRLIDDRERLRGAIGRLEAGGSTSISDGLREAGRVLDAAQVRPEAVSVVVLLTDGLDMLGSEAVRNQAAALRDSGIHLVTIALGLRADAELLREVASTPGDAHVAPSSADLRTIYGALADSMNRAYVRDVTVKDTLPSDMSLVDGSLSPAGSVTGDDVEWRLALLPVDGARLSLQVRPTLVGRRATNVTAAAEFVDSMGRSGRTAFPLPFVDVVESLPTPGASPSPSPAPASSETPRATPATVTPETPAATGTAGSETPSAGTGTAPPTAVATPSASAPPGPTWPGPRRSSTPSPDQLAYLPAVGAVCRLTEIPVDVVLVVDTSTTMLEPTTAGRTKLAAAISAVRIFAARLDPRLHRVGLVGFDSGARVLAELGVDSATLEAALQAVEAQPGSRIDMGLGQAGNLLRRSARTDARAMVVLLSDGRPAGASADDVRRAAAGLRDDSVTVYAVALGPGADSDLLGDVAGQRDRLVDAGDAEELDDVYAGIAGKLRCR